MPGSSISQIDSHVLNHTDQITNIEKGGFWMLTSAGEFFVSFEDYPDFRQATLSQIFKFRSSGDEFHWDELDIDIELDALQHPERFPLQFKRNS